MYGVNVEVFLPSLSVVVIDLIYVSLFVVIVILLTILTYVIVESRFTRINQNC